MEDVRSAIARGDVYQVNLVRHLSAPFAGDPEALAEALAPLRPLQRRAARGPGWTIVSASPERFLSRRGRLLRTCPIKGTRPAGVPVEGAKDAAEHVMIVDLERNDLSRVCEPGSVRWPELMAERELAGVTHLVSTVEGTLARGRDTGGDPCRHLPRRLGHGRAEDRRGRPDRRARARRPRRVDGGTRVVRPNGDLDLALTIRTFAVAADRIHLWVGGGIVWDSEPEAELAEGATHARRRPEPVRVRRAPSARRSRGGNDPRYPSPASGERDDPAGPGRDGARPRRPRHARPPRGRRGSAARAAAFETLRV